MAGTTTYYALPTVSSSDKIDGATQITSLATATDTALHTIASAIPSSYTLPAATTSTLGGIKVGSNLSVTSDGTLSATAQSYTLPTASSSTLGGVKVGTGLSISSGVLSIDTSWLYNEIVAQFTTGTTWGEMATNGFMYE